MDLEVILCAHRLRKLIQNKSVFATSFDPLTRKLVSEIARATQEPHDQVIPNYSIITRQDVDRDLQLLADLAFRSFEQPLVVYSLRQIIQEEFASIPHPPPNRPLSASSFRLGSENSVQLSSRTTSPQFTPLSAFSDSVQANSLTSGFAQQSKSAHHQGQSKTRIPRPRVQINSLPPSPTPTPRRQLQFRTRLPPPRVYSSTSSPTPTPRPRVHKPSATLARS